MTQGASLFGPDELQTGFSTERVPFLTGDVDIWGEGRDAPAQPPDVRAGVNDGSSRGCVGG